MGFGFVIRNDRGEVILAGSKRCRAVGDITFLEVLALRFALRTAIDGGIFTLIIETDSEILSKLLRREHTANPYTDQVVEDIWDLARGINCNAFLFVRREANSVAHNLAHFGTVDSFEEVWIEEIPDSCNYLLLKDVRREPIIHQ